MQMSFLGSIGHLIAGSGLQELLEVVYAGSFFGLGKGIVVKTLSDSHFYKCAETFTKKNVSKEDVIFVGDTALVLLYGGSCAEGLDSLRYKRVCDKVSKRSPTYFHCS